MGSRVKRRAGWGMVTQSTGGLEGLEVGGKLAAGDEDGQARGRRTRADYSRVEGVVYGGGELWGW